jgi:hypothetical protein
MRFDHDENFRISKLLLPAAVFLMLLFVPLYWIFIRQDSFLPLEKRYREQLPAFTAQNVLSGAWTSKVEDYLSDLIPARSGLLGLYNYAARALGMQNAQKIFVTQSGALVEAPCARSDEDCITRLETINAFARGVDQPVSLLIVPTAGYCAGQDLNALASACYFDDDIAALAKQTLDPAVSLIDVLPAFTQSSVPLYYSTDHHWNAQGAYLAYTQICRSMGLEAAPESAFVKSCYPGFYGTTYSRSGLWGKQPDALEIWNDYTPVSVTFSDDAQSYDSMFFDRYLDVQTLDKYPVFLDSNHPLTVVDNLSDESGKVLLLVKDSYANSVAPLLIHHYDKIVLVDLRYYKQDITQVIAAHNATDILVLYSTENIIHNTDLLFLWLK